MKQLTLSSNQLEEIGFTKRVWEGIDAFNPEKTTYEIASLNSVFYYNVDIPACRWYQRVNIGGSANHIQLNIKDLSTLFVVLNAFSVELRPVSL